MKKLALGLLAALFSLAGVLVYLKASDRGSSAPARTPVSTFEEALFEYGQRNLPRALELLKLYCDTNAHNVYAKILYAKVCVECGRVREASEILDELARAGRADAATALLRAAIAKQTGQGHLAAMLLQRAIKENPENAALWRELGMLQFDEGQSMQALSSFERSLRLDPKQEDLNRLVAQLSIDSATAGLPDAGKTGRNSMMPGGAPTAQDLMPQIPGMPRIPDPKSTLPRPGQKQPSNSGRPW